MDLRQLSALLAVADHGTFSAAARALHTVQSNVSTHVARLERERGDLRRLRQLLPRLADQRTAGEVREERLVGRPGPIRVALAVGGGLEYNFSGNTSALVGVKYSNGFTNVNKSKVDDVEQPKAKLHYFELTIGALF